ncbi:MAG: Ger(x)C family spore germination protein [Eubacteriaceae bacterium]|nr:Ger(x)C family spore germination protein [Eubacteriaceae bacterium]
MKVNKHYCKKLAAIVLAVAMAVLCSSCWNYIEISKLAVIMGFSVDKPESEGVYNVGVQIVVAHVLASEGTTEAYMMEQADGFGMQNAFFNIRRKTGKMLFAKNNQIIIISEEVAREGIVPVIDFFVRGVDGRLGELLAISKGSSAFDLLALPYSTEKFPALHINKTLQRQDFNADIKETSVLDFANACLSNTNCPIVPVLSKSDDSCAEYVESAVFKDGKMVGTISTEETLMLNMCQAKIATTSMIVFVDGDYFNLDVNSTVLKSHYDKNGDSYAAKYEIIVEYTIIDTNSTRNLSEPQIIEQISTALNDKLQGIFEALVSRSKEFNSDFFGIGEEIYNRYPKASKHTLDNWNTEYGKVPISATFAINAFKTGLILNTLTINGGASK